MLSLDYVHAALDGELIQSRFLNIPIGRAAYNHGVLDILLLSLSHVSLNSFQSYSLDHSISQMNILIQGVATATRLVIYSQWAHMLCGCVKLWFSDETWMISREPPFHSDLGPEETRWWVLKPQPSFAICSPWNCNWWDETDMKDGSGKEKKQLQLPTYHPPWGWKGEEQNKRFTSAKGLEHSCSMSVPIVAC